MARVRGRSGRTVRLRAAIIKRTWGNEQGREVFLRQGDIVGAVRWHLELTRERVEPALSGRCAPFSVSARVQTANRLLQAGTHFLFFIFSQTRTIEAQHFMPVLDLGLEQVALGRFHIFCPINTGATFTWPILWNFILKAQPVKLRFAGWLLCRAAVPDW